MNIDYGKVVKYDGRSGNIIDDQGINYLFLASDVVSKEIKSGDYVTFHKEIFSTLDIKKNVARFVSKININ